MGLEHFKEGVGPDHIHLLGASAPMNSNSEMQKVYASEGDWETTDPEAKKRLTIGEARKFASKVIFHSSMDEIPGIEDVRKNFDPKTDVVRTKNLWWKDSEGRPQTTGGMVTDENSWDGKPNRLLINAHYSKDKKVSVGGMTHEISHMLINHATFPNAGHNWAMARAHLHIVKNILGSKSHSALKTHYDKHGVNYGHKP